VPAPGMIWVAGRWARAEGGWYRVTGFWSPRRGGGLDSRPVVGTIGLDWRTSGPPADHPPETTAAAPGPNYFFVAGHYEPDERGLIWKPGFWSRIQPGWDWVPARWIRRASGWDFRPGDWVREPQPTDLTVADERSRAIAPEADADRPQPPNSAVEPGTTEDAGRALEPYPAPPFLLVVPDARMPYYVIRRPGSFPYGPGGVVVPGVVPRFVRRILDDVLP
jgi:hypothetical protein